MNPLRKVWLVLLIFLVGCGTGGGIVWFMIRNGTGGLHEADRQRAPDHDPLPEAWLLPPDARLDMIYQDEGLLAAIKTPERMTLHPAGGDGKISIGEYRFAGEGRIPDAETAARLTYALSSISAYEAPSACIFSPAVLLQLEKEGFTYQMMICFQCGDFQVKDFTGGKFSARGEEVLLKAACDTLPDFAALHEFRRAGLPREERVGRPAR